jgi:short-subunit dehydrogenase
MHENMVALVTGANKGIGHAIASALAARGLTVLVGARDAARGEAAAQRIAGDARACRLDVTRADSIAAVVSRIQREFGRLDVLVNNAGIGATGHFAEAAPDRLRQIMEVNFFGLTEMTRAALPLLKKGNRPALVNISSIAGKRGIPGRSEYSASKFAVEGFSEALRPELSKDGIDLVVVCPGLTQTNFSKNMIEQKARVQMDHLRGMTSEEVALATLRAIERGSRQVTLTMQGKLLVFVSRFFPRLADRIARKKVRQVFKDEIEAREKKVPV